MSLFGIRYANPHGLIERTEAQSAHLSSLTASTYLSVGNCVHYCWLYSALNGPCTPNMYHCTSQIFFIRHTSYYVSHVYTLPPIIRVLVPQHANAESAPVGRALPLHRLIVSTSLHAYGIMPLSRPLAGGRAEVRLLQCFGRVVTLLHSPPRGHQGLRSILTSARDRYQGVPSHALR